jgi:hypothetical protein
MGSGPAFSVGDRVRVRAGKEHVGMGGGGEIAIARAGAPPYYGVRLDDMPEMVHKWYAEDELEAEDGENGEAETEEEATSKATSKATSRTLIRKGLRASFRERLKMVAA